VFLGGAAWLWVVVAVSGVLGFLLGWGLGFFVFSVFFGALPIGGGHVLFVLVGSRFSSPRGGWALFMVFWVGGGVCYGGGVVFGRDRFFFCWRFWLFAAAAGASCLFFFAGYPARP